MEPLYKTVPLKRVHVRKVLARLCIAWIVRPDAHDLTRKNETGLGCKWSEKNRKKRFPQKLGKHYVF